MELIVLEVIDSEAVGWREDDPIDASVIEWEVSRICLAIARETDEALKYAVAGLENVEVMTYRVDFQLRSSS